MNLPDSNDTLDILKDSVAYQLQKMQNVEKTLDEKDWYQDLCKLSKINLIFTKKHCQSTN